MSKIPLLNHDSKMPLHVQAEELLRKLIRENYFGEEGIFPNETDLARRWGISRNTLRQALGTLVMDGLLDRKKSLGTMVRKRKVTTDISKCINFPHQMEDKGVPLKDLQYNVAFVKSNEEVARCLQIKTGTSVVFFESIRSTGSNPMIYFKSYFHPRIGLTGKENFGHALYKTLDDEFHIVPVYSQEEIRAVAADQTIAALMKIDAGEPLLQRKSLVLDAGRKPIEFNICYYCSNWFTFKIEIKQSN